jgi:hypothetical protein
MATETLGKRRLAPLEITCSSADCKSGLHCFTQTKKMKGTDEGGKCRYCGAELVDWTRTHKRDLDDVRYTFEALRYELWRHPYWHIDIDEKAINHARRKGKSSMRAAAERRLRSSVGDANPYRDGYQTPKKGNVLYYAQHATATCCRKCMEDWHGVPMGQALTDRQIAYFTDLVMLYIDERLQLTENGEYVPPIRRRS